MTTLSEEYKERKNGSSFIPDQAYDDYFCVTYPADGKCEICGHLPPEGYRLILSGDKWRCLVCEVL